MTTPLEHDAMHTLALASEEGIFFDEAGAPFMYEVRDGVLVAHEYNSEGDRIATHTLNIKEK